MLNKGKLIIFSAPSGSGKTTLINKLRQDNPELAFSISATTRKPRRNEKNGVEYFFMSRKNFKEKIDNNHFVEYKTVYGNLYGTLRTYVEKMINKGKSVIFDIDVQGALAIKEQYPDDVVMIFIYPPSLEVLGERLKLRGTDSDEEINKRLKFAKIEMEKMKVYAYNICNDSLKDSYSDIRDILAKEGIIKLKQEEK